MVSKTVNLIVRGLQFFWALLIMALVGNMIATAFSGNPSIVNYDMFVAAFSMLSLFYLIAGTVQDSFLLHPILPVVLDAVNTLLYFCGAVAMAAYLKVHSCSNAAYTTHNKVTNGSPDTAKRCRQAQATTAFLWFGFVCFTLSTCITAFSSHGPSAARFRPPMSQLNHA